MPKRAFKYPYPHNLLYAMTGEDIPREALPPDFEQSVEYVLENLLDQRESYMLVLRYLDGKSNREIGEFYGLTTQRVRQVIDRTLRKLRHPSRYRYLRFGCARFEPLPPGRKDRPPLGAALTAIPMPSFELPAKKRIRQIKQSGPTGQAPYPCLTLDGANVPSGCSLKVQLPDGWRVVRLERSPELTGHACWRITTPGYTDVCPIGLFAELGAGSLQG